MAMIEVLRMQVSFRINTPGAVCSHWSMERAFNITTQEFEIWLVDDSGRVRTACRCLDLPSRRIVFVQSCMSTMGIGPDEFTAMSDILDILRKLGG